MDSCGCGSDAAPVTGAPLATDQVRAERIEGILPERASTAWPPAVSVDVDAALVGLVAGSGWASGVNLYAAVALLGVLGRSGLGSVPDALMRTDVIVIAAGMFTLEFVADKIPLFDSLWDTVHTIVRPLGAVAVGALLTGDAETWQQAAAAVGAGGLATASHLTKATTRLAVNASPEPASNIGISLLEDGLVAGVIWLAVTNPVLALGLVVLLVVGGAVLTVTLVGVARRGLRARRQRRADRRTPPHDAIRGSR